MATNYFYPQVSGGYRWNLLMRCKNQVGIEPSNTTDQQIDGAWKTVLTFDRDLTAPEKALLDTLMLDNPTFPPTTFGTRFKIDDIWEKLANFRASTGIQWNLYFSASTPGGPIDTIELQASNTLNNAQKNTTKNAFAALIREG